MDKVVDGTHNRGTRSPLAKLTPAMVRAIRAEQRPAYEVGLDYGISKCHVQRIWRRATWAWLPDDPADDEDEAAINASFGR
jgi:hypothetical protein